MMAKLMVDSAVTWARDYRIDSFRFNLMGHQPRAVMQELQRRVDAAAGRPVLLLGEGWNFGEVADGARFVQVLAAALNAFSQGITYWHAGFELLRSKSMDRNSYDSGDWFNRLDWTGQDNFFGTGLPPARDNAASWPLMRPRLADPQLRPSAADIEWTRAAFLDLMRIRSSSTLFRLRSATDVQERLRFLNTGPEQVPEVIVAHLRGDGYPGPGFREVLCLVNVDLQPRTLQFDGERGKRYVLHPVHRAPGAADRRAAERSHYDPLTGRFTVPARTAVVFVME